MSCGNTVILIYTMTGTLKNSNPPYQPVYWTCYNTPDFTGQFSNYFGQFIAGTIKIASGPVSVTGQGEVNLPVGPASGDLSACYPDPVVVGLNGIPINQASVPTDGQVLTYDADGYAQWDNTAPTIVSFSGDVSAVISSENAAITVTGLQAKPISSTAPTDAQVLTYSASAGKWQPSTFAGGGITQLTGDTTAGSGTGSQAATVVSAQNGSVVFGSNSIAFAAADGAVSISQSAPATDASTNTLTISSQNAHNLAVTNINGGNLVLKTGAPQSDGYAGNLLIDLGNSNILTLTDNPSLALEWNAGVTPLFTQAGPAAFNAVNTTIKAQDGASGYTGGSIVLQPGGGSPNGNVILEGTAPTVSALAGSGSGIVAVNNSGVLSFASGAHPTGSASGDLSGSYPNPEVVGLLSNSLPSLSDGYLNWTGSIWALSTLPTSLPPSGSAGGDLSGSYPNPTVAKINGSSVSASPSANQVLVATSGTATTWEQISNAQVSSTAAIAVSKLAASSTDGYILQTNGSGIPAWQMMSKDVSLSNSGAATVIGIDGIAITGSAPSTNQALVYNGSTLSYSSVIITPGGDLSGNTVNQWVQSISGYNDDGGTVQLNINNLEFAGTQTNATINQAAPGEAGNATTMTIQAQQGGANGTGADLILSSGNAGFDGVDGYVHLQHGSNDGLVVKPTGVVQLNSYTTAGIITNDASGNLISVTSLPAADITHGTANQLFDTNNAGTASEWFTLGGDATFASHNLYVSSLSYSSSSAGGSIAINGTGTSLTFAANNAGPTISQAIATSGNGNNFTISAQAGQASGNTNGGNLILNAGAPYGSGTVGEVELQCGGTTYLQVLSTEILLGTNIVWTSSTGSPTISQTTNTSTSGQNLTIQAQNGKQSGGAYNGGSVVLTPGLGHGAGSAGTVQISTFGTAGVVTNDSSGNLISSATLPVTDLTAGTSAQVLMNSSTPTPTWTTISGDVALTSTGGTYVSSLSYSSSSAGGSIAINGTGTSLTFAANNAGPTISQANTASAAGSTFTISAQNSTDGSGGGQVGGGLRLSGGDGYGENQCGGVLITDTTNPINLLAGILIGGPGFQGNMMLTATETMQLIGGLIFRNHTVAVNNYTIDSNNGDFLIYVNYGGACSITLPAPSNGRTLVIQDISGAASSNHITINHHAGENINGSSTYVLNLNYASVILSTNGANWFVTGSYNGTVI